MVRVLFITVANEPYGATRSLAKLIQGLSQSPDIECEVVSPRGSNAVHAYLTQHKITFSTCNFRQNVTPVIPDDYPFFRRLLLLLKNKAYCSRNGLINFIVAKQFLRNAPSYDLIHSNNTVTSFGAVLARLSALPHVQHVREFGIDDYGIQTCEMKKNRKTALEGRGPSAIICNSKSLADYVEDTKTFGDSPTYTVYTPFEPSSYVVTQSYGRSRVVRFVMPARIMPGKNQIEAVSAFARARELVSHTELELHLFGEGLQDYLADLNHLVEKAELKNSVVFHGFVSDLTKNLTDFHVGLNCSVREAFSRSNIELLMHGLPIIASSSGGNPEQIRHGENGMLYQLGNTEQLAHQMAQIAENFELRKQMGEEAHRSSHDQFSVGAAASKVLHIYNQIPQIKRQLNR